MPRILLQKVFHGLAAAFLVAVRHVMADDALIIFIADLVRVLRVDAEADHEALVAQNVDRRLRRRQVEEADLGVLGLVAERFLGPLADQLAGEQVVGGEGGVGGIGRLERRVERDDQQTCITRFLNRRDDALGVGSGEQDALAPSAMQLSIAATWLSLSPSILPA